MRGMLPDQRTPGPAAMGWIGFEASNGWAAGATLQPCIPALPAMADPQTAPKTCPGCGAKLPEVALSICPYCVTPLGLDAGKTEEGESPFAGRLQRLLAHADLPEAMSWSPPEGPEFIRGGQLVFRGKLALTVGALAALVGILLAGGPLSAVAAIGYAIALGGVWLLIQGKRVTQASVQAELLRRPGVIADRRSETNLKGLGGSTDYYFLIEFEGGVRGEFLWPGRGVNEEPYPSNLPGVAYTRGVELVHFKHIRV